MSNHWSLRDSCGRPCRTWPLGFSFGIAVRAPCPAAFSAIGRRFLHDAQLVVHVRYRPSPVRRRSQLRAHPPSMPSRGEHPDVDDGADMPGRHAQRRVTSRPTPSRRRSRASSFSSASAGLALGVILPTRISPAHLGADVDDASLIEVGQAAASPTFGMSRVISSGPSLVSRAMQVSSSMWIEVKASSASPPARDQDRVLEVVAVPGHERDAQVLPSASSPCVGRGPSAMTSRATPSPPSPADAG